MSRFDRVMIVVVVFFVLAVLLALARAAEVTCPDKQPCKVITLTPAEEEALLGEGMILDTAQQGALVKLTGPTNYFRAKLRAAQPIQPDQK